MSQAQLEKKVTGYLHDSLVLQDYWQRPITAEQLQAEMDRMARDTKQPEVLRELFEALGNDPAVIAECLARPILAQRFIADLSAQHQARLVGSPQTEVLRSIPAATALGQFVYTLPEIADAGGSPCTDDTWTPTSTANAPEGRDDHTAIWTGTEMIVWGGRQNSRALNSGGRYNPSTDSWLATSTTNAPVGRLKFHTAVWTGSEMIVWGGWDHDGYSLNTGGRYNPTTDSWTATSASNAPSARFWHTAVWSGSEMIVWGGFNGGMNFNTGGRYNPSTDSWIATSTNNAPSARSLHTAVWTGTEMIIWAGASVNNTGGRYNPSTNTWTPTSTTNAPTARYSHAAVWTGSAMIVWGGTDETTWFNTGGRYRPSTDTWTATSTTDAPGGSGAVWTGSEMIAWGVGGGRYNPSTNSWSAMSTTNAYFGETAVWTGSEMIFWGGGDSNTGGRYCASGLPVRLGNISTRAFAQTGDHVIIGGFMVQGTEPKRVIIRAIGPELTQHGVPNALANPTLELHNGMGALIASNDNWRTTIIGGIITANQGRDIQASGYAPGDQLESAIIANLPAGNYTAILRGVSGTTGVALVEVYDLSPAPDSIVGNISTRSFVQTGDDVMIGGFIVRGAQPKRVILRAIGPSLIQYGVPDVLVNPTLELHDGTGALIASNNNWATTVIGGIITANQVHDIQTSGHAPGDELESAIIADLPPGNYTAIVRGVNDMTGVALVEVYDLDQ